MRKRAFLAEFVSPTKNNIQRTQITEEMASEVSIPSTSAPKSDDHEEQARARGGASLAFLR
jgi:hypothetical protein